MTDATLCSRGCLDECEASLVSPCPADTEPRQYGTEPAVPAAYTSADDVNPVCGCHRRSQCRGCGSCTNCDACYCGEDCSMRAPAKSQPLTLGEHFFWTVVASVAACLTVAVALFVAG